VAHPIVHGTTVNKTASIHQSKRREKKIVKWISLPNQNAKNRPQNSQPNQKQGLLILQWNAKGLRSRAAEIKNYLAECVLKPDIICVQETNFKPTIDWNLVGYNVERQDHPDKKIGGGVATFVRQEISYNRINTPVGIECVAIRIKNSGNDLIVVNFYQTSGTAHINTTAYKTLFSHSNLIAVGDANSHNTLWGSNETDATGQEFETILDELNLSILNDGQGTFIKQIAHGGGMSAIDITIASPQLALRCNWEVYHSAMGSDHYPILTHLDQPVDQHDLAQERFNCKKADWASFKDACSQTLNDSCRNENLDLFHNNITTAILEAADASIPKINGLLRPKSVPYWNEECGAAIKNRNKALKTARATGIPADMLNYKKN